LPALVFATQSPYSGWQNVVNSRNVMRNAGEFTGLYEKTYTLINIKIDIAYFFQML
jgi:hypothetical protein